MSNSLRMLEGHVVHLSSLNNGSAIYYSYEVQWFIHLIKSIFIKSKQSRFQNKNNHFQRSRVNCIIFLLWKCLFKMPLADNAPPKPIKFCLPKIKDMSLPHLHFECMRTHVFYFDDFLGTSTNKRLYLHPALFVISSCLFCYKSNSIPCYTLHKYFAGSGAPLYLL